MADTANPGDASPSKSATTPTDFLTRGANRMVNVGVNIFDNYTTIGSIFFEAHGPVGEGRSFSKHHKLILGFRLLF
jgi:hypothetical protein